MNIAKRSTVMKNPNTPIESIRNQRKYSFTLSCIAHDVIEPVKTMIADNTIIRTEMPSTPNDICMSRSGYQTRSERNNMASSTPLERKSTNHARSTKESTSWMPEPTAMILLMVVASLLTATQAIINSGTITKRYKKFI